MNSQKRKCPGCKRSSCDGCGIFQQLNTNKQISLCFPKGFQADAEDGLGISFDAGTTTLAGMLWDLKEGALLAAVTKTNPQVLYGADVVSRLQVALESDQNALQLKKKLVEALDEMAESLIHQINVQEGIKRVVIVGNTAMCELLLQIKPVGLAGAPFKPDYQQTVTQRGKELGFRFLAEAKVDILPPVGGYVGADALAVYSYIKQEQEGKSKERRHRQARWRNWLAIDIGTNGEILLQCGEKAYACSTAAGPALEGGAVSCGMRAASGALDRVALSGRFPRQDVVCHVIADAEEKGICGSGLVDVLAILLETGALGEDGCLKTEKEARDAGVPEGLCRRLVQRQQGSGEEASFVVSRRNNKVYITQKDIRQMQLSIGAIRAGIETLLRRAGITAKDLGRIYLAGAFGSYIGLESGIRLGLFPNLPREIYIQAGNLAGMGAAMALLSKKAVLQMEHYSRKLTHVELAEEADFQELFLKNMSFTINKE